MHQHQTTNPAMMDQSPQVVGGGTLGMTSPPVVGGGTLGMTSPQAVGGGALGMTLPTTSVLPRAGQEQMKSLLADSIINLCKNSLHFSSEISVEALVGVTLDKQNILLMNINKSISCDQVTLKKDQLQQQQPQPEPPKRRKKGASPNKRKTSTTTTTAPPNKIAPPPNQSLDMYHRPWDQSALPPNVTIKTEPMDGKDGTVSHSELRAHLESGIGAVARMPFQQQQQSTGGSGLFVNGVGGNSVNQVNCSQLQTVQQLVNGNNGSQGSNNNSSSSSSLNTRSALYQHLQQQQQQRNLQQQLQQQQQQQQQQTIKNARNPMPPREQNQQLIEQVQQNQTDTIAQQQPPQFQTVEAQLNQPQLRQNRSLSWTHQRSLSVDTSVYSNASAQSSLSSSPMSSQAATPVPQSSPENLNLCASQPQVTVAAINAHQNIARNFTGGYGNMKLPVATESVAPTPTMTSPTTKGQATMQNSSLMQHLQAPATNLIYSSIVQNQVQQVAAQVAQFSPENHSPPEGTPVSTTANFTFTADVQSAGVDTRALTLTPQGVDVSEAPSGLENTPGVMSVEQAEDTAQKSVALGLEADDDSDQDDFTSPEKPKRRKSLLNGDVFLGYVHPKPELDRRPNGHLDQVDTSAYINWKPTSGEDQPGGEGQVEIKQELPDWAESYGSDDNNDEEESYDQEENGGAGDAGDDDSADDEPTNDLTHQSGNSNFVNEMLEQMEVSPDGEKKCPICSRVLKAKSDMGRHIRTHTKEKPHKCQECGRGFLQSYDLKRHRMQHSGRKPFQCCVCSKGFTRPDYLRNHQQVWHPELYKDC